MEDADEIDVEVCYALPGEQTVLQVKLAAGATAQQAIDESGILKKHPEIDLKDNKIGVFGKLVRPDVPLQPGDRVEIYRPLIADPKESRRRKVEEERKGGAAAQGSDDDPA